MTERNNEMINGSLHSIRGLMPLPVKDRRYDDTLNAPSGNPLFAIARTESAGLTYTLPDVLEGLLRDKDVLVYGTVQITTKSTVTIDSRRRALKAEGISVGLEKEMTVPVYVVAPENSFEDVVTFLSKDAEGEIGQDDIMIPTRFSSSVFFKGLPDILEYGGWLDMDHRAVYFINEEMYKGFCSAYGVEKEFSKMYVFDKQNVRSPKLKNSKGPSF